MFDGILRPNLNLLYWMPCHFSSVFPESKQLAQTFFFALKRLYGTHYDFFLNFILSN